MKGFQSFVVAILMVTSTKAAGSGPYLPSGWRPQGPAFLLPGEIDVSPAGPLKPSQETLAAGSDSLQEYGPPKLQEVPQDITQQALPDEATGPPFYIIRADFHEDTQESEGDEATTEQGTESTPGNTEATQEDNIDTQSKAVAKSLKFDSVDEIEVTSKDGESESKIEEADKNSNINSDNDTESKTEESVQLKSDQTEESDKTKSDNTESVTENSQVTSAELFKTNSEDLEHKVESLTIDADEETANANNEPSKVEKNKLSGVNNIAEALVNLEEETKTQQNQDDAVKKVADTAGSAQPIAEGFLEYGPPGFKEYGPPPLSKVVENQSPTGNEVDNNEARRRRFSPKFKTISSKKH